MGEYRITFNHISALIFISSLSLLIFPENVLIDVKQIIFILGVLLLFLFLCQRFQWKLAKYFIKLLMLLFCFLFFFHSYALMYLMQAKQISQYSSPVTFPVEITKILKQQEYQRVIARGQLLPPPTFPSSLFYPKKQYFYLNWPKDIVVKTGQTWQIEVKLKAISSRLNIGGFDRQKWLYAQRIIADGKVKRAKLISEDFSWRQQKLNLAREQTENLPMGGLLLALGFGERAWLSAQIWRVYQQSNTSHLIAISGLHIGLAMLMGFVLARFIQGVMPTRWIEPNLPLFSGLCFAFFYAWLAGFNIPTLRAFLAVFVVVLIKLKRYHCSNWQLLLWIAALILLFDPLAMLSHSFWLSFGAVSSLLIWYQFVPLSLFLYKGEPLSKGKWRYLWGIIHLQIGLFWLFTPIQLFLFNGFSLLGFEANLIAVPFFSFILVPCVLWASITNGALYGWQIANTLAQWIHNKLIPFSQYWESVSLSHSYFFSFLLLFTFLIFVLFLQTTGRKREQKNKTQQRMKNWLSHYQKQKLWRIGHYYPLAKLKIRVLSLSLSFLFALYFLTYLNILQSQSVWRLSMLDVGQGLAILISKNQKGILYDTGIAWRGGSMAQLEIMPYMDRQGLQLEQIILSHDDYDHSGGVRDLLNAHPNIKLMQSSYKNYAWENIQPKKSFCQKGKTWHWQGLSFEVLWPEKIVNRAKNEESCVLLISDGQHQVLLMGDAGIKVERKIIHQLGHIDILQVGHHGSRTASSLAFLQKIKPKIALISVGRWNPWNLPNEKVLANFKQVKSQIYSSREVGQTLLEISAKGIQIQVGRGNKPPWYRALVGEKRKSEYNKPFFYL